MLPEKRSRIPAATQLAPKLMTELTPRKTAILSALSALVCLMLLVVVLRLYEADLSVPLQYLVTP